MIRTTLSVLIIVLCTALSTLAVGQDRKPSPDGIWQEISDAALRRTQSQRPIVPDKYRTFSLNMDALRRLLNEAPMEFTEASRNNQVILTVPMPDGTFARFRIEESPVMEAPLAAQYPELKTYRAQGIDHPADTMRFDLMPSGFHAIVLSPNGTVYVDPFAKGDTRNYISYFKTDLGRDGRTWECYFTKPEDLPEGMRSQDPGENAVINGSTLRTYRLALAATNEYTVAVGGNTVAGAMAAQVLVMNRVNGVYEKDVAIHMNIVANNNLIIYAGNNLGCGGACNAGNDPYTNSSPTALLAQNQATCDSVIGTANYDIGHVFSTGGGGVATLNSPCNASTKARGETGLPNPVGDPFAIDFVAHEMGHQFGAQHTFNGTSSNCGGGNRSVDAAVEPGSGVTIMGYAGICGAQDLSDHSIDTFSVMSLEQIVTFRQTGGACGPATATGNTPPTPSGGGSFAIPKNTPFALVATATDPNGDTLTYSWEEFDFGPASPPDTDADGQPRPIFRPYLPELQGKRNFPTLTYILNNANVPPMFNGLGFLTGEILPSISRDMTFLVAVRDNRANGGGINTTGFGALTVIGNAGPFNVTAPNTGVSWAGNSSQTVTWNVNGTSGAPINTANVKISLSIDGGNTFPTTILASTPNDGTQLVTIPNTPAAGTARIKVEAVGNIYFDISDVNFTITLGPPLGQPAVLDFDGDGKTDYAVSRDNAGTIGWYLLRSTAGFLGQAWGTTATDQVVPGDYDGDGKWDIAVWRAGSPAFFYILQSSNGALQIVQFGQTGDDPRITQDFDADGKADPAVTRNVGGQLSWYILRSTLGFTGISFGNAATDLGTRGDFDGDGKADVAVYRKDTGSPANTFYVLRSSDGGVQGQSFGVYTTDNVVPGDFDGDGKTDYCVWRGVGAGSSGTWYWLQSSDGGFRSLNFGTGNLDRPVPGDYDGDHKTDQAVWRTGTPANFYVNGSAAGFVGVPFGQTGDNAVGYLLQSR